MNIREISKMLCSFLPLHAFHILFKNGINLVDENSIDIDMKPFTKAIKQASFAAASFETNNLLSGVVCDINENTLEMASTDGNRLARVRENINNLEKKSSQLIIPSKTTNEFLKMSTLVNDEKVKIYTDKTKFEELDKEYQSIKSELLTLKKENYVTYQLFFPGQHGPVHTRNGSRFGISSKISDTRGMHRLRCF